MTGWDGFVGFLDKWQTLITGFMALGAAVVALGPVKKQLALMRAQNNVMVRETIGHMITQLDVHRDRVDEIISKPVTDIHSALWHFETYGDKGIEEWASQTHSAFNSAESELKALFITSHDVEAVEQEKDNLLSVVNVLSRCLWDVVAPTYADMFPEDNDWTEDERAAAVSRSIEARKELDDKASNVSQVIRQLKDTYANQRAVLVRQLRVIDDGLLSGVPLQET